MYEAYRECQNKLLVEELNNKNMKLEISRQKHSNIYEKLRQNTTYFDLNHIHVVITTGNEKIITNIKYTQNRKLEKLLIDYKNDEDRGKIIYNFSTHHLTVAQTSLLSKGLNFAIPPNFLRYEE